MDSEVFDIPFNGSDITKVVDASTIQDARKAIIQLLDSSYERIFCKITATQTHITITTNVALPAGTYRLVVFQEL
jgi:hypothetical protein